MKPALFKLGKAVAALIVPAVLLMVWFWLYSEKGELNSFITSPPEVWQTLLAERFTLAGNSWLSLRRLLVGVGLGVVFGSVSGLTLARVALLRTLFSPILQALSAIPFLVLIPFFLMVFGFGEAFRISVIAASTFLIVNGQAFHVIRQLNPDYFELARIYEKNSWQLIRQVIIPASLPAIISALRLSLLFAWLAVALAEKAVAEWPDGGLGYYILRGKEQGQYSNMFAGVIVLAFLAWALDRVIRVAQLQVSRWCDTNETLEERENSR